MSGIHKIVNARRKDLVETKYGSAHAGLLLDRYVQVLGDNDGASKRNIQELATKQKDHTLYTLAYQRWLGSLEKNTLKTDLAIQGRLVTGLGAASALETGLNLHHTYGVPWLPGSGLKGLAAHYCAKVWGASDNEFKKDGKHYQVLFGDLSQSGALVFHDGWWVPDNKSPLLMDVMTPHHSQYDAGEAGQASDFDMPVPISFLSAQGKFSVAVSCQCNADQQQWGKQWAQLGLEILTEALANWGFGGKTSAGYGRVGISCTQNAPLAQAMTIGIKATASFKKAGDKCHAEVTCTTGQHQVRLAIEGSPVVNCNRTNYQVGDKVLVVAREWNPKKSYPSMVAIEAGI